MNSDQGSKNEEIAIRYLPKSYVNDISITNIQLLLHHAII
ncbi:Uncharacterised protein [Mycobacteroides abscessus subsp. abscessus]|nr:Uncharacterised protein [Mycobacteroides abscessus subsp. abscessus]